MRNISAICSLELLSAACPAAANEVITYTYDARGRITKVEHAGAVNNGVKTEYWHDRADNRNSVKTTGSSG